MAGHIRPARRPRGWVPGGPVPPGDQGRPELVPADDEDLSYLAGEWRLFQKRRGHRWSLDDLVTADVAARYCPHHGAALDLGCGQGSVLLLLAWRFPGVHFVGVEAQAERAALARRSISYNGVTERCVVRDGDLRDAQLLGERRFALVTGTPPYFPPGTGVPSALPHAEPCRFELAGGVEDYLDAALLRLAPSAVLVICSAAIQARRLEKARLDRGLHLVEHVDVIPRAGKAPLVMVDVLGTAPATAATGSLTVRDATGQWTADFLALRARFGMPPRPHP